MTSALKISLQVFVPATFEERPGLYASVTSLTYLRELQRAVSLFYETDRHSWGLTSPATFLSTVQQRQPDLQQRYKQSLSSPYRNAGDRDTAANNSCLKSFLREVEPGGAPGSDLWCDYCRSRDTILGDLKLKFRYF
ncbi:hypothetical protein WJX74_000378 [Apatococcus lobatus]|uniref:Uncharacterized protein n=1 Tax=Apatococcus lobatus TaxID=904363 RepID=A0AAW1S1S2_9CHLO